MPLLPQLKTVHRLSSLEKAVVNMRSEMQHFGNNAEKLLCPGDRLLTWIDTRKASPRLRRAALFDGMLAGKLAVAV